MPAPVPLPPVPMTITPVPAEEGLDLSPGFLERLGGHGGVVPGSKAAGRLLADEQAFFPWDTGQRELIRVQEAGCDRATQPVGELAVGLLRHGQIAVEQLFGGTQDVAAAATQAQKQDIHVRPLSSGKTSKSQAMTTHLPSPLSWPPTNRRSFSRRTILSASYARLPRWSDRFGTVDFRWARA